MQDKTHAISNFQRVLYIEMFIYITVNILNY